MKRVFSLGLIFAVAIPAVAADEPGALGRFQYALSAGATHTDNVGRTRTNKQSETSGEAGLTAGLDYARERATASLDANLQYRMHNTGSYGNELAGGLVASGRYRLTERLSWMAEDNLGQSLINSQDTATPDNTQNVNIFTTGPDLALPLGARTSVNMQGRWSDVSYGKSSIGNTRLSGSLSLQRQLGDHSSLSLNGSTARVSYDKLPSSSDYDTRSATLGWNATGARTTLDINAGYTKVDEGPGLSTGGGSYGLEITRKTTARSVLSLNAGRSYGDSADALRRDQGIGGVSPDGQPAAISVGPLKSDYATIGWTHSGDRSSLSLSADWRREASERDPLADRDSYGGGLTVNRRISERLSFNFFSDYTREDFKTTSVRFNEWSTGIGADWTFNRAFSVGASMSHVVGDGDTSQGANTRDYTENRYTVRLTWSPR